MSYCESPFHYRRRQTREVVIGDPAKGGIVIGGGHPIVKQSMLTSDTKNTEACVAEASRLIDAGCQLVRVTAPMVKAAANLENISRELRERGYATPLVADIHFLPAAAMEAVKWVEKVRVNPGNYADSKKFATIEYSDEEYQAELARIEERFTPLVLECKARGRAMRIGTNHGSLSDRIMNRFGDTPLGMVESALEFAHIARKNDFHNFLFSMKSSNPKVMIECYRLLVARLDALGPDWNYPLHLGVTEAGDGEDGRIKSAIGIGSLLMDGVGDTIRVSLTEDAAHEIPVCRQLLEQIPKLTTQDSGIDAQEPLAYDPFEYRRHETTTAPLADGVRCGGEETQRVVVTRAVWDKVAPRISPGDDVKPEGVFEDIHLVEVDPRQPIAPVDAEAIISVSDEVDLPAITAFRLLSGRLAQAGLKNPILLKDRLAPPNGPLDPDVALIRSSVVIGSLLADGIGDAILIRNEPGAGQSLRLAYNILQSAGCRSFKTDYVACPSCGRTLFDLQEVTARIRAKTDHLKGVKIAIMGCIVNGPGEMADADFGYVGGAPGKINLYVGKTAVKFNIPEDEAVDRLIDLIREHGKWREPKPAKEETAVV